MLSTLLYTASATAALGLARRSGIVTVHTAKISSPNARKATELVLSAADWQAQQLSRIVGPYFKQAGQAYQTKGRR